MSTKFERMRYEINPKEQYRIANRLWRMYRQRRLDWQTYNQLLNNLDMIPGLSARAMCDGGEGHTYRWMSWRRESAFRSKKRDGSPSHSYPYPRF